MFVINFHNFSFTCGVADTCENYRRLDVSIAGDNNYLHATSQSKYRGLQYVHSIGCGRAINLNLWGLLIQFVLETMSAVNMRRLSGMMFEMLS
jgi:hypothetical protein